MKCRSAQAMYILFLRIIKFIGVVPYRTLRLSMLLSCHVHLMQLLSVNMFCMLYLWISVYKHCVLHLSNALLEYYLKCCSWAGAACFLLQIDKFSHSLPRHIFKFSLKLQWISKPFEDVVMPPFYTQFCYIHLS